MVARPDDVKKCAYCLSINVRTEGREGRFVRLLRLTNMWFSPDAPGLTVGRAGSVSCGDCGAAYTTVELDPGEADRLFAVIGYARPALVSFKALFGERRIDDVQEAITAVVEPSCNTLHVLFSLDGRRAYISCKKASGHFVALSVVGVG